MTLLRGQALRDALAAPGSDTLVRIVCRLGDSRHATPDSADLTRAAGLRGDRWIDDARLERQVTIMDARVVRLLLAHAAATHDPQGALGLGEPALDRPGDNLVIDGPTGVAAIPPGSRLSIGTAELVTNGVPHRGCKKFAQRFGDEALAWVNEPEHDDLKLRGIHATVVVDGRIAVGDRVTLVAAERLG